MFVIVCLWAAIFVTVFLVIHVIYGRSFCISQRHRGIQSRSTAHSLLGLAILERTVHQNIHHPRCSRGVGVVQLISSSRIGCQSRCPVLGAQFNFTSFYRETVNSNSLVLPMLVCDMYHIILANAEIQAALCTVEESLCCGWVGITS
jgi:hypothetical protein